MTVVHVTMNTPTYRFACPSCDMQWKGDSLSNIASQVAWHWNKEHNSDLKHNYEQIDTVERGGHRIHENEYSVTRIPIYITAFDVMERIGKEDGYAVLPDAHDTCTDCLRILRNDDRYQTIEERYDGNDTLRCYSCIRERDIKQKQEANQQLESFMPS